MRRHRLLITTALLIGSACSNGPGDSDSAMDAYRRGVAALEQGQPRTARVEFMNAIKGAPNSPAIRLMQARTYLALGDGVAAEAELNRARQLGVRLTETHHLMAHALLLQGQAQQALDEAAKAPPEHSAYAARMRGRAQLALGNEEAAAAEFSAAMAVAPRDSELWTDVARFRRATGELAGAVAAADRAVALDPGNVEALGLKAELTRSQYGLRAAIPWFDRALEIDPNNVPILVERAATLGDLGEMSAMLAETRKVLSLSPDNAMAFYLQSMMAARAGKFELARSLYRRTRGALDGQPAAMLLASAIELQTGNAMGAIQRLTRLIDMQPDNRKARRLLAAAQWRRGDAAGTIATLRPVADLPDADSYVLTLMGRALEKLGETGPASVYLARAALPKGAGSLLGETLSDSQLATLRQSADSRPGDAAVQVQLIRALLARGLGDEALQRARVLRARNPGAPDAHVLVGDSLGVLGDFAAAAEEYRKAANIAFTEPVAMRLIEALRVSGDAPAAAGVLALFLQQNPQSVSAQMLAANDFLQAGQWDGAIAMYERLRRRIGDRDATLLNNLAWAYSQTGDFNRALPLARKAWLLDRGNPATADTLGWLLFKSGVNRVQGIALLEQAARGAPTDQQIRRHLEAARRG